ncbi:23S rRNA (uracil(1939)-C(5))-methyltransferase RlmD [Desulfococcaceae bacterium HSG8]|nr:23S rRNA (uracil(1939)-C(5))-methyltransferase RlmD [Desulfococcaceae bacterium HSG8]
MSVKKGQTFEIEITDIAFGGKGLARIDGLAVFVDQAVPSDHVKIRITKKKKNYAEARVLELIKPSPLRTDPPCRYSGHCGGCKWQFLGYEKQLHYKQQHVAESLEHIGGIQGVLVHPTIPSERIFGYRNKMEFSCSDRRWLLPEEMDKPDADRDLALGLHVPGTFWKVLDTEKCLLQPDLGNSILEDVRQFIKHSDALVYSLRTNIGFWRFLMLRHSAAHDQWMVNIVTASENRPTVQPLADLLTEKYPGIVSVVNNITSRKAGIAIGEYEILLAGESVLKDKIRNFDFEISANSFFQTNTLGAERLYETVKKYAGLTGGETVVDLYSGTGTIPLYLSDSAKTLIGMEIIESAVADAEKNCRINGVTNCRFILGDIKDCFSQLTVRPDVMIIDPPRVGMHKDVVKQVLQMAPERIVYVSCNPATLARDLDMMKDCYHVSEVQPVDMFPHTYHIESVARLVRDA